MFQSMAGRQKGEGCRSNSSFACHAGDKISDTPKLRRIVELIICKTSCKSIFHSIFTKVEKRMKHMLIFSFLKS